MRSKLPEIKEKKKIDATSFIKRAKALKKYFEEEIEYMKRKSSENENLSSGRSF